MSSTANTWGNPAGDIGTLNGLFKETYGDKLKELIPDGVKVLNMIKFMPKNKQPGNLFHQPVVLGLEHGLTYASSDDDAFNLLPPVAGQIKDAQVKGNPKVLRSLLGYTAAARAAQGGAQAFMDATKFLVSNMLRSMAKKLEIEMIYGQYGYGVVDSTSGATITIVTAEWAPGIWAGAENMPIEIRSSSGAVSRGDFSVVSVSFNNRTVTVNANLPGAVVNGDVIWAKGAYGNEFVGIHRILTLTSGNLFNIPVGNYNLFQGNQFDCQNGALSFPKLTDAAAHAIEKGQEGKLVALINVRAWANLLNDQAALRKYDESYNRKRLENGSEALTFYSQNGEIEIMPSIYVKEGYTYLLSEDEWSRVGSTDMTFNIPGRTDEFLRQASDAAAYELRLFTDQAVFTAAPGRNVILTGIVNSAA